MCPLIVTKPDNYFPFDLPFSEFELHLNRPFNVAS